MSADLVTHPEVVRAIVRILRRAGVAQQDTNDGVGDVQLRILKWMRLRPKFRWPKTVEEMKALAIRATKTELLDRWKKAKRRKAKGDAGAIVEDPDSHAAESRPSSEREPIDQKRFIELLRRVLDEREKGDIDARILDLLVDDEDQASIGEKLGLSHQQVRDRLRSMRAAFALAMTATFSVGGALVILLALRVPQGPTPTRYYQPSTDVAFNEASPDKVAAEEREQARAPCRSADWDKCLDLLDAAAQLDPQGDQAREIQAVRDAAQQFKDDDLREREVKFGPNAPKAPPKAPKPAPAPSK
jgi:DNA-directed RNA polymerase specialized sigma24 family protein